MADIKAFLVPQSAVLAGKKTAYLDHLQTYRAAQQRIQLPQRVILAQQSKAGEMWRLSQHTRAYVVPNYYTDLYRGVKVIPHTVSLGSISTAQSINVTVWNSNRHAVELAGVEVQGGESIQVTGKAVKNFRPLAMQVWQVHVSMMGAANIDCTVLFRFVDSTEATLRITGSRSTEWLFAPDWSDGVSEKIEFLTTVHQSLTGAEQRIAMRLTPRRTFEFKISAIGVERQQLENSLYGYGARVWGLPIYPHQAHLTQTVSPGDKVVFLATQGFDFTDGGKALLTEGDRKEMVEIDKVNEDSLLLKRAIAQHFSLSAVVYPLRSAVLTDMPQVTRLSDGVATAQVRFQIQGHNDYATDVGHLPTYRGHPVLEPTSEWSEDVTAQYQRLIKMLDNNTGLPYYLDTAQNAFQVTSHHFMLEDVAAQHKLRKLFYYLRGRQKSIWVASSTTDFDLVEDINGQNLYVRFVNYTNMLLGMIGRQNIRIELTDGSVHYKRIVSAVVVSDSVEQLTFDGEPLKLAKSRVLKISYLSLSRLESDTVNWVHQTNTFATVAVSFRSVREDLEI